MDLFHESKNKYFHLVLVLLNKSCNGIDISDFIKVIDKQEFNEKLIGKDFKNFKSFVLNEYSEEENLNLFINKDNNVHAKVTSNNEQISIPIRLCDFEKRWLKYLISEPLARELLGENIVNLIENKLNYEYKCNIEITNKSISLNNNNLSSKDIKFIFLFLKAVINNKVIKYTSIDRNNELHKDNLAIPIRIEYSLKDEKIRFTSYLLDEKRIIMCRIKNIHDMVIDEEMTVPISRSKALEISKNKKYVKEPIILKVTDIKNAMERFFMNFSSYERYSRCIDINLYEIKLYYYEFQREEVVRKIISLGPYVKVIEPQFIINEIIEYLKSAANNYEGKLEEVDI